MDRKPLSVKQRFDILKRDSFTCQYCGHGAPGAKLHVDHVIPVALGGPNHYSNLVTACHVCNNGKRDGLIRDVVLQEWLFEPIGFEISRTDGLMLIVSVEDMEPHVDLKKIRLQDYVASGKREFVGKVFSRTGYRVLEPGSNKKLKVKLTQWLIYNGFDDCFCDDYGENLSPIASIEYVLVRCAEIAVSRSGNGNSTVLASEIGRGLLDVLSPGPDFALTYEIGNPFKEDE